MRVHPRALALGVSSAVTTAAAQATTLAELCTIDYDVTAALPVEDLGPGITIDASSVSVVTTTTKTVSSGWYPTAVIDYCTVTFAYSYDGLANDTVHVSYLVPPPSRVANR